MLLRLKAILLPILLLFFLSGCRRMPQETVERNGLHSDKKPSEIAKERGKLTKKQMRASKKEHRRMWKAKLKRDRMKQKGKYYDK